MSILFEPRGKYNFIYLVYSTMCVTPKPFLKYDEMAVSKEYRE